MDYEVTIVTENTQDTFEVSAANPSAAEDLAVYEFEEKHDKFKDEFIEFSTKVVEAR